MNVQRREFHMCRALPLPTAAVTKYVRCPTCGQFWKRSNNVYWQPVKGFTAWRLRRQMRAMEVSDVPQ
ncbi:hypothetical protein ACH4S8_37415 [Streptomyces sp. NPDC021080]|uniref:hypothetical protein n=1 Tax=Streptomyces sp. NPDC021080 TaxID=3365110 RepID=UPI0037877FFF